MNRQDKIDEFLSEQTNALKDFIDFAYRLISAQPQSTDVEGRPYITYSYGVIIDPIYDSISSSTKLLFDKVMEKLTEISKDKPTINGNEHIEFSFRRHPTFTIEGDRLRVTFRCLSYVIKSQAVDEGVK